MAAIMSGCFRRHVFLLAKHHNEDIIDMIDMRELEEGAACASAFSRMRAEQSHTRGMLLISFSMRC